MPEISIIIPIYNKGKYLNKLWENLLGQTFTNYECILIDDGSVDDSPQSCDWIVNKDNRFKVFHIKNGGVSHARNVGLDHAKGNFITFIDADDSFHNEYLKRLYECISENDVDMVISSSLKVWENSDRKELIKVPYDGIQTIENVMQDFVKFQMDNGIYGYCWGKLLRSNLVVKHRFNEKIKLAEDLEFYLSLYPEVKKIYFDNQPQYYYLQEAENSSMLTADWEIDYYTQLIIQLKMYQMLQLMNFLNSENKTMLVKRMYDYVFFTLYHAPKYQIKYYAKQLRELCLPPPVDTKNPIWQYKWIIGLYRKEKDLLLCLTIRLYRLVRGAKY